MSTPLLTAIVVVRAVVLATIVIYACSLLVRTVYHLAARKPVVEPLRSWRYHRGVLASALIASFGLVLASYAIYGIVRVTH